MTNERLTDEGSTDNNPTQIETKNADLWNILGDDTLRLKPVGDKAYVTFEHGSDGTNSSTTQELEDNDDMNDMVGGETVDEEVVEQLISELIDGEQKQKETVKHFTINETESSLGYVSNDWKKAGACLFFGSLLFMIGVAVLFLLAVTISTVVLFTLAIITLTYGGLRFGLSYYIYRDAKLIHYHSVKQREEGKSNQFGWAPRPLFWAVATFFLPPFVQYLPMVAYLYRRRERTGVP